MMNFRGTLYESLARIIQEQAAGEDLLGVLTGAIDANDRYTGGHSKRVALIASQMAQALGLEACEADRYRVAGLVHDVGKIGVPRSVLRKPGPLTAAEFEQVKRHPEVGYRIVEQLPMFTDILPGVLHHHEHWSGCGYPRKLVGPSIPLMARVLALADTYDAMRSSRVYRHSMSRDRVLSEIDRCAGTQFDPELVPVFLAMDFGEVDRISQAPSAPTRRSA